jgi:hypothetical protein
MRLAAHWPTMPESFVLSAPALAVITLACAFGCALAGLFMRDRLPAEQLSRESQDVIRLGMGLVATMTALLLGMVTATARSAYDSQDAAIKTAAANILTLDRHLARLGDATKPTRDLLRRAVEFRLATTWPDEGAARGFGDAMPTPAIEDIQTQILAWETRTDAERFYKSEALKLSEDVMKTRWRLLAATSSIPRGFLGVVIFWLAVTFTSFGLYAPRNATVISALFVAALSVALALFLIVELDGAFDGYIRISPEPLRFVLQELGK